MAANKVRDFALGTYFTLVLFESGSLIEMEKNVTIKTNDIQIRQVRAGAFGAVIDTKGALHTLDRNMLKRTYPEIKVKDLEIGQ